MPATSLGLLKGHATGNDFILLPDPDGEHDLTAAQVAALCDRRRGVGANGVLRVVPAALVPEAAGQGAEWFMDYRNADGSLAEMCGNGIRLFGRYLVDAGLVPVGTFVVATRGGPHELRVPESGDITVTLAPPTQPPLRAMPVVSVAEGGGWNATAVLAPNPHAVVFVDDLAEAGALTRPPEVVPEAMFPDGANVEFVVVHGPEHIAMRVHERGVGETLSCGTGAVAAAWAARRQIADQAPTSIRVDVPGGTLRVTELADGRMDLTGPAVVVARVDVDAAWWAAGA